MRDCTGPTAIGRLPIRPAAVLAVSAVLLASAIRPAAAQSGPAFGASIRICTADSTSASNRELERWPDGAVASLWISGTAVDWSRSEVSWALAPTDGDWGVGAGFEYPLLDETQWAGRPSNFGITIIGAGSGILVIKADGQEIHRGRVVNAPGTAAVVAEFERNDPANLAEGGVDKVIDEASRARVLDVELHPVSVGEPLSWRFLTGAEGRREALMREALEEAAVLRRQDKCQRITR